MTEAIEYPSVQPVAMAGQQQPGLTAKLVAITVIFVLTYDFPTTWFVLDRGFEASAAADPEGFVPAILVLGTLFAVGSLMNKLEVFFRLIAMEPLLPAFLFLALISFTWSEYPAQTLRFAIPMILVLVLGYWMVSVFRLEDLLLLFCFAFLLGTLINYVAIFALPQYGQSVAGWSGISVNKNAMGRLAALASVHFTIAAFVFKPFRLVWLAASGASVVLMIGSESATSLAGTAFVHGLLLIATAFRARKTLYGALTVAMVGGGSIAVFVATANLGFLAGLLGKDVTLTGRTTLWIHSLEEAMNRPYFGHAWGGFWQGPLSPARPVIDVNDWNPPHAHNALIDYFLVLGVVGALLAVGFFLRFTIRSARAVRYRPGTLGLWPIAYAGFAFIFSITEFGVISRSVFFLLLVIHISVAGLERRDEHPERLSEAADLPTDRPLAEIGTS